ncbi:MAG: cell division protein SepF [Acidimicrobiales bacterium]
MWRRAMLYLGLGPDEDYEDYDVLGSHSAPGPVTREPIRRQTLATPREHPLPDSGHSSAVRPLGPSVPGDNGYESSRSSYQPGSSAPTNGHTPRAVAERPPVSRPRSAVRAVAAAAKPHVVAPASFTDAQEVADEFKRNVPVIVNLQGVERDLMRRIIDFASGLCYGLGGQMERVANYVYLLTPSDVEVAPEERRRWGDRRHDG